jgi:hypothetical protein
MFRGSVTVRRDSCEQIFRLPLQPVAGRELARSRAKPHDHCREPSREGDDYGRKDSGRNPGGDR